MTVLVAGATGATGRLLVAQLLERGHHVRAIVRSPEKLPEHMRTHPKLEVIQAVVLDLSDQSMRDHITGCDAIASCLGHNLTFKGINGKPRKLVTDAVKRLCDAARAVSGNNQVSFVLMNTTGNRNRDLDEPIPFNQRIVIALLRMLLPPHVDNEQAAEYLRTSIGQDDPVVTWVAVRPDTLIDESIVSDYSLHPSPTRNPIFDAGKTSRINVAHFMADLITDETVWNAWQGQMPVIYNEQ